LTGIAGARIKDVNDCGAIKFIRCRIAGRKQEANARYERNGGEAVPLNRFSE